jgi:hypothetical protein
MRSHYMTLSACSEPIRIAHHAVRYSWIGLRELAWAFTCVVAGIGFAR